MSALQRLRFFSFCSAFGTVVLYNHTPVRNFYHYVH